MILTQRDVLEAVFARLGDPEDPPESVVHLFEVLRERADVHLAVLAHLNYVSEIVYATLEVIAMLDPKHFELRADL